MGCCSSKDCEDPASGSPPIQALAAPGSSNRRNDQSRPVPGNSNFKGFVAPKATAERPHPVHAAMSLMPATSDVPSHHGTTAVDRCLEALSILESSLSSMQIPDPHTAPRALSAAIQRVHNMCSDEEGWVELTKRLQYLSYFTNRIKEAPEFEYVANGCLAPAAEQLEQLAIKIDKAGRKKESLQIFLTSNAENNSIASHHTVLDRLISELTSKLCMDTSLTMTEVRKELKYISESLEVRIVASRL